MEKLQVAVVSYNSRESLEVCLRSLLEATLGIESRISVFDNASIDGSAVFVRERFPGIEVRTSEKNIGFGAANNTILESCKAPYALLINPDTSIYADSVGILLDTLEQNPDVAIVGPRLEYEDGSPQVSFGPFPSLTADFRQRRLVRGCRRKLPGYVKKLGGLLAKPFSPDWVSGACMLARVDALKQVGFFHPQYFLYLEDVDLCKCLRLNGWSALVQPAARCRHQEGGSHSDRKAMQRFFRESRLLYENRHGNRLRFLIYRCLRARGLKVKYDRNKRYLVEDLSGRR